MGQQPLYQGTLGTRSAGRFVNIVINQAIAVDAIVESAERHIQVPGDDNEPAVIFIEVVVMAHGDVVVQVHHEG